MESSASPRGGTAGAASPSRPVSVCRSSPRPATSSSVRCHGRSELTKGRLSMRRTGFYAVLILLALVAIPAATQLTVQQNGNVDVGTSTKGADLQVYGLISG